MGGMELLVSDDMPKLAGDGDDRMPKVVMPMVVLSMVAPGTRTLRNGLDEA